MASLSKRAENKNGSPGNYYIRLWLPNQKRSKSIPLGTYNKKEAELILKRVQHFEYLRKAEQSAIKALYQDVASDQWIVEGIEKDLGLDQSLSLKKAVEIYLNSCKKRVSINTVKSYDLALRDLTNAITESIRVTEIGKMHNDIILSYLKDRYNDTTVNIRLRGIRAFFTWMEDNDYIKELPFKVKMIKLKERLPKFLTPQELQAIYDNCDNPVMISIFKVYEGTGMRLSELKNSFYEEGYLRVIGKGNKERLIHLPPDIRRDYQIAMEANYKTDRISKGFTQARRRAKVSEEKTLHSLRHTFALKLWAKTGDIKFVQESLGHSSVTVTEVYTKVTQDYLKRIFSQKYDQPSIAVEA